jgi:diguanylate cyclase (GGDEF)-like protein/PAS domain S-box-containing protein
MTRAARLRWGWLAYLAGAVTLAALYATVKPLQGSGPVFNLLGLSPVLAIVAGIRLHRPASAAPWWWFAGGFALFWLGDLYTYSYPKLLDREVPFPSPGDAAYVAVYPVLIVGLLLLVRRRAERSGDRSVVDAAILSIGLALPSWLALIAPYLHDGSLPLLAKLVSVAYPLGDVLLLAVTIRLALDGGRRGPAFFLMSASIVALLITDFVYGLMILNGTYDHQMSLDLGWVAFYVLFGAAALHPSMTTLDHADRRSRTALTRTRLALLACASVIAPALELSGDVRKGDEDLAVVTSAALLLFGLVVVRMAGLMRSQERAQERERALSEEIARRQGESRLASLVRHSSDLITVLSADATIAYQSPAIEPMLGWNAEEVVGRPITALLDPAEAGRLLALMADGAEALSGGSHALECTLRHRDGTSRQFEVLVTDLLEDEHVQGIVLNSRDVSERKAFERQLAHQAFHDPVTGLPNRALFVERVRHALARGRREDRRLAVVFIDLDDFKLVNDSLGHAAGDEVLVQVAQRLASAVRASDTAARFGGDEFAVLLEDIADVQEAADAAERIMEAVSAPLHAGHNELVLRCSIGLAIAGESADADELIRDADAAMYIAKRDGKAGYRLFEPEMHAGVLQRLELRTDLQRALVSDQLELYYQPVDRLGDGSISGVEALLRWHHPERGLISPDEFIPLAEETGLIVPIGRWVLREGCRHGKRLLAALPTDRPVAISINLSLKQLQHSDVVADVRDALAESGLPAGQLTLEITESVLMADTDLAVQRLGELKELGVKLALDDFGTGYSSLSYLSKFPVDVLKMDRSFLREGASPQQTDLATAVVALGSTLSLEVVAEGIELPEQWDTLRELGCELGQGFYFARPMNAEAAQEFLARGHAGTPAADASQP